MRQSDPTKESGSEVKTPLARALEEADNELLRLRELARTARITAAMPEYDEEAIRDALWMLVDAVLDGPS